MPPELGCCSQLTPCLALFRQQEHKVYLAQYMDCGVNIVETHANMSGMLGDCGHRRTPFKKRGHPGTNDHPAANVGHGGRPDNTNMLLEENKADQADQAYMTCATYLTGQYTPISSAPWTSESFQNNLFPRPAMQTANRDRQGPPPAMAMATAAGNDKIHRRAAEKTTLVTHAALTLAQTTMSGTTELLTLRQPVTADADAAQATTSCVTAVTTEWTAESFSSEYPSSSSSPSSNCTITTKTKTKTKHHTTTTCTASESTLSFSEYPSSSISSAMASYLSASPTALTIPIQSGETVIVKLKTTTYTIVDGVTQTAASFVPEESSTSTTADWGNSSTTWTGYPSSVATLTILTDTSTGYSTSVSGEPDGYITAWSWTADGGATTTSTPPWVTEEARVVERGEESCVCWNFGVCRCTGKTEEEGGEGEGSESEE